MQCCEHGGWVRGYADSPVPLDGAMDARLLTACQCLGRARQLQVTQPAVRGEGACAAQVWATRGLARSHIKPCVWGSTLALFCALLDTYVARECKASGHYSCLVLPFWLLLFL